MHTRRVVVTGIGAVTPLGLDMESTWEALINGRSGVGPITRFDSSVLPVHVACEVRNFDPTPYIDPREVRRTDLFEQYALAAAHQAVKQAGLTITPELADEVGVVIGSSVGGFNTMLSHTTSCASKGRARSTPLPFP